MTTDLDDAAQLERLATRLATRLAQLERREKSVAKQRREAVAEGDHVSALALSQERRFLRDRLITAEQEIRALIAQRGCND